MTLRGPSSQAFEQRAVGDILVAGRLASRMWAEVVTHPLLVAHPMSARQAWTAAAWVEAISEPQERFSQRL